MLLSKAATARTITAAQPTAPWLACTMGRRTMVTPCQRRSSLRRLLRDVPLVRALEVHNGLTALIAEKASVDCEDGTQRSFDPLTRCGVAA